MDHKVFISYSSRDALLAERIHDRLERDGVGCWISSRDVPPGADFQGCIVNAIDAADLVLLVFSSEANHSNEIAKELSLASKKLLIPARIEDVLPEGAFRFQLTNRQFFDLFEDFDRRLDDLSKTVQAALAGKPVQHVHVQPAPGPAKPPKRRGWLVPVAAVALLAVAAGAWWWLRTPQRANDIVPVNVGNNTADLPHSGAADTPSVFAEAATLPPPQDALPVAPPFDATPPPAIFADAQAVDAPAPVEPAPPQPGYATAPSPYVSSPPAPAPMDATTDAATGPSFDCAKAATQVERSICADAGLSRLDRQLSAAYRNARVRSTDRAALQRQQNIWRREVRDACTDPACIASAHEMRIRQLDAAQ